MKPSSLIKIGGNLDSFPVYPELLNTIGINETIFLCRICWWQKTKDEWVEKSVVEIQKETGLTYKQQIFARERLTSLGLIEQEYFRLQHVVRFRILQSGLDKEIAEMATDEREDAHMTKGKVLLPKGKLANCPKVSSSIDVLKGKKEENPSVHDARAKWIQAYTKETNKNYIRSSKLQKKDDAAIQTLIESGMTPEAIGQTATRMFRAVKSANGEAPKILFWSSCTRTIDKFAEKINDIEGEIERFSQKRQAETKVDNRTITL